jgi:hypothetical protein
MAASVLIIIGAAVWFMRPHENKVVSPPIKEIAINPEIKEAEIYYASIVETKRTQLSGFGKDYPDLFKDFQAEMDTLHVLYGQLLTEYKNSNGNEAVSQALIENLQMQVQLLSKQLEVVQDIKQKENKKVTNSKLM